MIIAAEAKSIQVDILGTEENSTSYDIKIVCVRLKLKFKIDIYIQVHFRF